VIVSWAGFLAWLGLAIILAFLAVVFLAPWEYDTHHRTYIRYAVACCAAAAIVSIVILRLG
jgi:hypothetical protein